MDLCLEVSKFSDIRVLFVALSTFCKILVMSVFRLLLIHLFAIDCLLGAIDGCPVSVCEKL